MEFPELIHDAAFEGDLARVVALIEEDADRLNAQVEGEVLLKLGGLEYDLEGCTPLMLAIAGGHNQVVERLISLGARLDLDDDADYNATHWACWFDRVEILESLMAHGAELSARARGNMTHLMVAGYQRASACTRFLLHHDPQAILLDATDDDEQTALHHVVKKWNNAAVVRLLLEAGADPTIKDCFEQTPAELAAEHGHDNYTPLLQAAEAEPQRALLLGKARALSDVAHVTRALPACLRQCLPTIRLLDNDDSNNTNDDDDDEQSETLRAVARHVAEGGLIEAHVKELLAMMLPRWAWPVVVMEDGAVAGEGQAAAGAGGGN